MDFNRPAVGKKIWIPELEKYAKIHGVLKLYMATSDDGKFYPMVSSHIDPEWNYSLDKRHDYCVKLLREFQSNFVRAEERKDKNK